MKSFTALVCAAILSTMAATAAPTTIALADSYRLERLSVRSGTEKAGSPPSYLHVNPGDEEHLYQGTTRIVDSAATTTATNRNTACPDTDSITLDFSLHIANRFHAILCLTPSSATTNNDNTQQYQVQVVGRMSSTRMYPMDPDVLELEREWTLALPTVTAATIANDNDDDHHQSLILTGPQVDIRFRAIYNVETDEGSE